MFGKWLLRIGVGAAAALVAALIQYLQGVDVSELGVWATLAGAVILVATWALGNFARWLQDKVNELKAR